METLPQENQTPPISVTWQGRSKRRTLGLAAGIATTVLLLITGPWYLWPAGPVLALLHWRIAGLRFEAGAPRSAWKVNLLWGIGMLALMCIVIPIMVKAITLYIPFEGKLLMNLALAVMIAALFFLLLGSFRRAVIAASLFLLAVGTVNGYVFLFRDRELTFLDIYSASTALKVSDQYSFLPSGFMVCGWSLAALGLQAGAALPSVRFSNPSKARLGAAGLAGILLLAVYVGSRNYTPERWRVNGSIKNGYLLNFYLGVRDAFVIPPADYSPETVGQLEDEFDDQAPLPPELPKPGPNILVIMNESYCDLSIYPNAPATEAPVTPFWDSLKDNIIRGYALSSVYGGNTANSEFEFLTGSSMAFLPSGSVPYSQYLEETSYSLAWVLKNYGYSAHAVHCYHAMGWNRDQVYPLLGFDSSTFLDQFPQEELLRSYISDREQYAMMLKILEQQEGPAFLFGVTMQNHGGYQESPETYPHTVTLSDAYQDFPQAEQYLCLVNASDQALEELLTALESYPEDTLVLFFGDHQPKLEPEFYEALNGGSLETLADQMLQHTVPFMIWANFDIQEKDLGLTSLNYLAGHLLDAAGLQRTAYHHYLKKLEQTIPAMNALGYWSNTAGGFVTYDQAVHMERHALRNYELVQYNALFDRKNSSILFFDQYLPPDTASLKPEGLSSESTPAE